MVKFFRTAIEAKRAGCTFIKWVGEPHTAFAVNDQIVRDIESFTVVSFSLYVNGPIRLVTHHSPRTPFASVDQSLIVHGQAIGIVGVRAVNF